MLSVGNIEDIDFPFFTPSDLTDKQICVLERWRIGVGYIVDLFLSISGFRFCHRISPDRFGSMER